MNKHILAMIVLCATVLNGKVFAQINFEKFDWDKLTEKAKTNNQLIMVDMTATWCHWCKVMDQKVFSTAKAGKFYNANFISTKLYDTHPMGKKFNSKYKVSGYPTMLFLDHTGKLVHTIGGALTDIDAFIDEGKIALAAAKKKINNSNNGNNNEEDTDEMTLSEKCDWLYDLAMDDDEDFYVEYAKFAKTKDAKTATGLQLTLDLVADGLEGLPLAEFKKLGGLMVEEFGEETVEDTKLDAIESRVSYAMAATKHKKDISKVYNRNLEIVKDYYFDNKTNFLGLAATVASYDDIEGYILAAKTINMYAISCIPLELTTDQQKELIAGMLDSILYYEEDVEDADTLYAIAEEFAKKAEKKYPSAALYMLMSDMYSAMGNQSKADQYEKMAE